MLACAKLLRYQEPRLTLQLKEMEIEDFGKFARTMEQYEPYYFSTNFRLYDGNWKGRLLVRTWNQTNQRGGTRFLMRFSEKVEYSWTRSIYTGFGFRIGTDRQRQLEVIYNDKMRLNSYSVND